MKNSIVTSIEKVVISEYKSNKYFESVWIGLQLGIFFMPLTFIREVAYPLFNGLYYIALVIKGAIEDVAEGFVNFCVLIWVAFYCGFHRADSQ